MGICATYRDCPHQRPLTYNTTESDPVYGHESPPPFMPAEGISMGEEHWRRHDGTLARPSQITLTFLCGRTVQRRKETKKKKRNCCVLSNPLSQGSGVRMSSEGAALVCKFLPFLRPSPSPLSLSPSLPLPHPSLSPPSLSPPSPSPSLPLANP